MNRRRLAHFGIFSYTLIHRPCVCRSRVSLRRSSSQFMCNQAGRGLGLSCLPCLFALARSSNNSISGGEVPSNISASQPLWNQVVHFSGLGTASACLVCYALAWSSNNNTVNACVCSVTPVAERAGTATPEYFNSATALLAHVRFLELGMDVAQVF